MGQAKLTDLELEQAASHISGLLGHALSSDAACHLAAQLRHVTPHAQPLNHINCLFPGLTEVPELRFNKRIPCYLQVLERWSPG